MRVRLVPVAFVLLLVVGAPSQASAGLMAFFDYLNELSGPGPFKGAGGEASPLCFNQEWERLPMRKCLGWPRLEDDRRRPRLEFGPHFSRMRGEVNNDLTYPGGPSEDDRRVSAFSYGAQGNLYFWELFGVTARITRYHFHGELVPGGSVAANSIGLGAIFRIPIGSTDYQLTVSPIGFVGLDSLTAADFGALGEFERDNVVTAIHIGFGWR